MNLYSTFLQTVNLPAEWNAIEFSRGGKYAIDYRLRQYDIYDGKTINLVCQFEKNTKWTIFDFSPDETKLAYVDCVDGKAKIVVYDIESKDLLHELPVDENKAKIKFSPDGEMIIFFMEKDIKLWYLQSNQVCDLEKPGKRFDWLDNVGFSFCENVLVAHFRGNPNIYFWNVETKRIIKTVKIEKAKNISCSLISGFSLDNRIVITTFQNQHSFWDISNGNLITRTTSHNWVGLGYALSPDNKFFAYAACFDEPRLINLKTDEEWRVQGISSPRVCAIFFLGNGTHLAFNLERKALVIYDIATETIVQYFDKYNDISIAQINQSCLKLVDCDKVTTHSFLNGVQIFKKYILPLAKSNHLSLQTILQIFKSIEAKNNQPNTSLHVALSKMVAIYRKNKLALC